MPSITDANAVLTLSVPLLFPVPFQVKGFAADDVYDTDDIELATTIMGVDGILSGGYVNSMVPWNLALQADSPTMPLFEAWDAAQQAVQDVLSAQGSVTLVSVGRSYRMVTGFLVRGKRLPDAKKTLMSRKWRIDWQQVISVPVGSAG